MRWENIIKRYLPFRIRKKPASVHVTTAEIGRPGKTSNLVFWNLVPGVAGYNLYRSKPGFFSRFGLFSRSGILLNKNGPIAAVNTFQELKALLDENSAELKMLEDTFASLQTRRSIRDPLNFGLKENEKAVLDTLTNRNLKIRLARGLGYIDQQVTAGTRYKYELRGVREDGSEIKVGTTQPVVAGRITLPSHPVGLTVEAGDNKVLATWERVPEAFSYQLQRATQHPGNPYQIVNDKPIFYNIEKDLDGNVIDPPKPGFVDYRRWDEEGHPTSHQVKGVDVSGPKNGLTYYYQVAACDILGRKGPWSDELAATPLDSTPPTAPTKFQIHVIAYPQKGLKLSWHKVTRDINDHQIQDDSLEYRIYRADILDELDKIDNLPAHLIHTENVAMDGSGMTISWTDTDPILEPEYGEQDFWYRIQCVDEQGNASSPSAALSGRIPDTTPPGPTEVTETKGHPNHISVFWIPNSEEDLAGYQVYRSICDRGKFYVPSDPTDEERDMGCDFMLVGTVPLGQAEPDDEDRIHFDDYSVPAGSPICYAYWVRAYDVAQNLYPGERGCPASKEEYACGRLHEDTPPPAPVITGLNARNNAVQVEWISSPVQDLHGCKIYRSDSQDAEPLMVGCCKFSFDENQAKWEIVEELFDDKLSCQDIPAEINTEDVKGSFLDNSVEPKRVYWYRVSALDKLGNESEDGVITKIPAVSTFTFSTDVPDAPVVHPQGQLAATGCGLRVLWDESEGATNYLVFRSESQDEGYRQVSPPIQGTSFSDESALRNKKYFYRVQALNSANKLSEPSDPVEYKY